MKTSSNTHRHEVRSYELDPYRHVNNSAYINWCEDGRERFLRTRERDYIWYPDHEQSWFVVVRIDCEFLNAALSGEVLSIKTRLARTGRTSVVFRQSITRDDGTVCARARVVMAFSDGIATSKPIPQDFHDRFEVSPEGDVWAEGEGPER